MITKAMDDLSVGYALREALYDGGLPHTRFTDQDGVVLLPTREDLYDALYLFVSTDRRIQFALAGQIRKVPTEVI
jgi:hypothetical protein